MTMIVGVVGKDYGLLISDGAASAKMPTDATFTLGNVSLEMVAGTTLNIESLQKIHATQDKTSVVGFAGVTGFYLPSLPTFMPLSGIALDKELGILFDSTLNPEEVSKLPLTQQLVTNQALHLYRFNGQYLMSFYQATLNIAYKAVFRMNAESLGVYGIGSGAPILQTLSVGAPDLNFAATIRNTTSESIPTVVEMLKKVFVAAEAVAIGVNAKLHAWVLTDADKEWRQLAV